MHVIHDQSSGRQRGFAPTRSVRSPRGAVAVEAALVLSAFLTTILGMLDLGIAVLNRNNLSAAAHRLARTAIVRGEKAAPEAAVWGPSTWTGTAASAGEISTAIAPILVLMPLSQVHIQMEWPDGGHQLGQRVRVTLTYTQHLICGDLLGLQPWQMTAVSVMRIQH
jgi:hypothetical protein